MKRVTGHFHKNQTGLVTVIQIVLLAVIGAFGIASVQGFLGSADTKSVSTPVE